MLPLPSHPPPSVPTRMKRKSVQPRIKRKPVNSQIHSSPPPSQARNIKRKSAQVFHSPPPPSRSLTPESRPIPSPLLSFSASEYSAASQDPQRALSPTSSASSQDLFYSQYGDAEEEEEEGRILGICKQGLEHSADCLFSLDGMPTAKVERAVQTIRDRRGTCEECWRGKERRREMRMGGGKGGLGLGECYLM